MSNQRGISAIAVILVLLLLLILAGGGFFYYRQKMIAKENTPPSTSFENVDLNEEVVVFLFREVPSLYSRVARIDNDLVLIAEELDRIQALEEEYPSEKRTIASERMVWLQLQKELLLAAQTARTASESYYVAHSVNEEKGRVLVEENIEELLSRIDEILETAGQETVRLQKITEETLLDRLKGLFS